MMEKPGLKPTDELVRRAIIGENLVQNGAWLGWGWWNDKVSNASFDEVRVWRGVLTDEQLKEAGIRTHIIVCCAAALTMIVSKYGFADLVGADGAGAARRLVNGEGIVVRVALFALVKALLEPERALEGRVGEDGAGRPCGRRGEGAGDVVERAGKDGGLSSVSLSVADEYNFELLGPATPGIDAALARVNADVDPYFDTDKVKNSEMFGVE